jgi:hypothetical protein
VDNAGRRRPARSAPPQKPRSEAAASSRAPDPLWVWAEAAGRNGAVAGERSALDEEAAARLRMLQQAAGNFAARLPSVDEWAAFVRDEIAPVYNALAPAARMCAECGARLKPTARATTRVCSPECASTLGTRQKPRGSRRTAPPDDPDTTRIDVGRVAALGRGEKDRGR